MLLLINKIHFIVSNLIKINMISKIQLATHTDLCIKVSLQLYHIQILDFGCDGTWPKKLEENYSVASPEVNCSVTVKYQDYYDIDDNELSTTKNCSFKSEYHSYQICFYALQSVVSSHIMTYIAILAVSCKARIQLRMCS